MLIISGIDVGMLALLAAPGVLFLVIELLIMVRTDTQGGCLVPIGIAVFLLLLMWTGYSMASGWDTIGWAFLIILAGSALVGSLLGGGIGLVLRKRHMQKGKAKP